jgi:hypothetical protein
VNDASDPADSLSGGQFSVRIVESDGNVVELAALIDSGAVCVITEMTKVGEDLVLSKLHIDGPGVGSSGIQTLRALARMLGRQQGVRRVIVHGGVRTTGARAGRVPRPIIILVEAHDGSGSHGRLEPRSEQG